MIIERFLLSDKMPQIVSFVNCLLGVPQACFGDKVLGSLAGTPLELSEKCLQNLHYEAFCDLVGFQGIVT